MTTYAYDNWIQLPTKDLYDTQVMAMAINAARDMYEKGEQRIKDFNTTYGDFITPIQADQDWYNQNVTGKVRDTINNLYARGIDPLRSAEGRAIVAQLVNNIPVGEVAKLRSSAKAAEEYLKNRGKLEAAGLYNPDLEERYLGYNLSNWDTLGGGKVWDRLSPTEAKTLKEATESWYNNRTPEILNQADVESFGMPYDRRYNYTGFADRHLLDIAAGETPGWRGSLYADYYRNLAERKVAARGIPYTQADVERQLQQDIATANREYKSLKRDADEFELDLYKTKNQDWLDQRKSARDLNNALAVERFKAQNGGRGYSGSSSSSSSSGSEGGKESLSEAQYQLESGTTNILGQTSWGRASGISTYQDFSPERLNYLLPAAQAEIAWRHYDNTISGGNGSTISVARKKPTLFNWNAETGKFEPNVPGAVRIGAGLDITTNLGGEYKPATTKDQIEALKTANRAFLNDLSTSYTPAKFAQWTNKSTVIGDSSMINITRDDDAINRIYSLDEIALDSYGTGRPKDDLDWAKTQTNSIRRILGLAGSATDGKELCIKSIGKQITKVAKDGAVHQYQLCKAYQRTPKGNKYSDINKGEIVAYDMGVDTYANPNFGINGNTDVNLYFDEAKDADVRWTGDQSVLHWEHVAAPAINSTIAYPQLPVWDFETSNWK